MDLTYITLEEAAVYEGMKYRGMASRVNRNPDEYDLKTQPREGGGRPQVLVSVASLSPKARRAYKAAQAVDQEEAPASGEETPPWYVEADLNSYIESNKRKFYEAVELANQLQCLSVKRLLMQASLRRLWGYPSEPSTGMWGISWKPRHGRDGWSRRTGTAGIILRC